MIGLSVVVPTCGRSTLARTLDALAPQLCLADEVLVVADGPQPDAREICRGRARVVYREMRIGLSRFGNAQRDFAIAGARGTHLLFIDDDDAHEPDALEHVRRAVGQYPPRPHVFRARWGAGHHAAGTILWTDTVVREQNIATPMVVLPRRPFSTSWLQAQLDARADVVSDYGFLAAAIADCGEPVWHEQIIATVRP